MIRKVPLIVILGSTGTGKTKLSLELAERFGGEIISADSMQVYANLDIATAKATREEQSRVRHHLLDVATPSEPFTVMHFRNKALPIIENLLSQSKCPIVVGGTNYYIESLLWDILVSSTSTEDISLSPSATASSAGNAAKPIAAAATTTNEASNEVQDVAPVSENSKNPSFIDPSEMLTMQSEFLHNHLRTFDPETANRIHPNNKRKIIRAIEFYQESGQTLSSKLKEQRQQPGGNRLGGPLRYPHTILFWLRCNQEVLNARLDNRVDGMLEQGLLREIRAFHNEHNVDKSNPSSSSATSPSVLSSSSGRDYTKGVLQTIGFKEFIPYLERFSAANDEKIDEYLRANAYKMPTEEHFKQRAGSINEPSDSDTEAVAANDTIDPKDQLPPGLDVLNSCLNELKLVTRRYSKKQQKWINNRFLASNDRKVPDLYELDTSDVGRWHECVYSPAVTIIDCYRSSQVCEIQPMKKRIHPGAGLNEEITNFCAICQRHFIGEYQWNLHLKSNRHKKRKESVKRKQAERPTEEEK
uniref:C2H2-type domain-containing protein n=1 Tax=Stomoxys calcitrans TaxID=35570 RepID=A0A1I8NV79_STOCA